MTSPSLELQAMIVARLKAVAGLTALIVDRVYDQVPLDSGALIEIGGAKLRLVSQPGEA